MTTDKIYDLVGIGIGPFNLGLAALTDNIHELDCLFIDKNKQFNWHPGLMLPTAKMQVPFYADLVTLADPTSPFTYMNYLKETDKLFRFAINESYFPYRSEYNGYCGWVTKQLNNLYFNHECKSVSYDEQEKIYEVRVLDKATTRIKTIRAKHLVIGVGSSPFIPDGLNDIEHPNIFHASHYLPNKNIALMQKNITLIGSGQSAAEIFQNLLPHINNLESLKWYTMEDRFYAMDYSKFALEMSSPEYIHYFYHLPKHKKKDILARQHDLYKGINFSLIDQLYEELYVLSLDKNNKLPIIRANTELKQIVQTATNRFDMQLYHHQTEKVWTENTEVIILATGYRTQQPLFLDNIKPILKIDGNNQLIVAENYSIDRHQTIFVQNAEWHTHGFNSADLALGPHRNAVIINAILQREEFAVQPASTFQQF